MKNLFIQIIFLICIYSTKASRILGVFTFPAKSHFTCNNAVLRSLADAGHEITVITVFPQDSKKENYTVIDVSDGEELFVSQKAVEFFADMSIYEELKFGNTKELSLCEKVFNLKEIQDAIKSEKKLYDVLLLEMLYFPRCYYWLAKKLHIPVIGVLTLRSWLLSDWDTVNPRHFGITSMELGKTKNLDNFYQRILNIFETTQVLIGWYTIARDVHYAFYQKYVKNEISFDEFMNLKPSLAFYNTHHSYFPRAMNPNVIEIGGITTKKNQPLPQEIQNFLDEAVHGAILFTFGSVIRTAKIAKNKIQAFKEAFAEISQRVIWKYEEELEGVSSNVMLMKWVPQSDILAHKNIKAFISHVGQGAVHESIYHGVPLVTCPLFADQHSNTNVFLNLEIAVNLDYDSITKENVLKVLHEIINNTKYYEKMQKISQLFKDRPMPVHQLVNYWTEYVIKHQGAHHLMSNAAKLNWFQYFLLDVIIFMVFGSILLFYTMYFLLKLCYISIVLNAKKLKKNKNE